MIPRAAISSTNRPTANSPQGICQSVTVSSVERPGLPTTPTTRCSPIESAGRVTGTETVWVCPGPTAPRRVAVPVPVAGSGWPSTVTVSGGLASAMRFGLCTVTTSRRRGAAPNYDVHGPAPSSAARRTCSGFGSATVVGPGPPRPR